MRATSATASHASSAPSCSSANSRQVSSIRSASTSRSPSVTWTASPSISAAMRDRRLVRIDAAANSPLALAVGDDRRRSAPASRRRAAAARAAAASSCSERGPELDPEAQVAVARARLDQLAAAARRPWGASASRPSSFAAKLLLVGDQRLGRAAARGSRTSRGRRGALVPARSATSAIRVAVSPRSVITSAAAAQDLRLADVVDRRARAHRAAPLGSRAGLAVSVLTPRSPPES